MSILSQTAISDFAKGLLDRAGIAPEGVLLGSIIQELQKVLGSAANLAGEPTDGDRHVTTSNLTVSGLFSSGSLLRNAYFDTLKVDGSGSINVAQRYIRAKKLDLRGAAANALKCNGNNGAGQTAGAAIAASLLHAASGAGGDGGGSSTTTGSAGSTPSAVAVGNGGAGGDGGAGGTGGGGAGGASQPGAAVTASFHINTPETNRVAGATLIAGGGGGGGGSGGGGSGAAAGGAGGGGGSGGGVLVLIVGKVTGTCPNLLDASGGTGGAAGAGAGALAGAIGVGGAGGRISIFNLSTGETTIVAGGAASGVTGGSCVASV